VGTFPLTTVIFVLAAPLALAIFPVRAALPSLKVQRFRHFRRTLSLKVRVRLNTVKSGMLCPHALQRY
jgi:hypothetical protein